MAVLPAHVPITGRKCLTGSSIGTTTAACAPAIFHTRVRRCGPLTADVRALMRKGTLATSLVGTIGAAMLFTVSLPSCGCQEPWMDFLLAFGVEGAFDSSNLDGKIITAAAQKHLIGKPLTKIEFPKETQPTSCISKTPRHFDCEFWFIKGLSLIVYCARGVV